MRRMRLVALGLIVAISITGCSTKEKIIESSWDRAAEILVSNEIEVTEEPEAEESEAEEPVAEEPETEEAVTEEPVAEEPEAEESVTEEPETEEPATEEAVTEEPVAEEPEAEEPIVEEPETEEAIAEEPIVEEPVVEELPEVIYTVTGMDAVMHASKACKIYVEPSTDYDKLGSLVAGQAIRVTGKTDNDWYQVEFCGNTGYIKADLLKEQEPIPEPTPAQTTGYNITPMDVVMFSTCDSLIFNGPDTASGVMGSLVLDQAIRVTGQTDTGWYQVEFCGNSGYMTMDMLTPTARVKARNEYTEAELIQMVLAECVTPEMSARDKAIAINNYLCNFCEYDYTYTYRSTYDALTHGQVVCQGYANAYKKLMEAAGVKTDYISGQGWTGIEWGSHGWNRVTIDGVYYYVDVTWNDSMGGNYYLLMDYDTFHYDHYQQRVNPYRVE
ncbi:MAG: SH3 domain-containing protein [Lachnospiraceae bacterium]|nr:SH3 domain-containing protein [Lachnospiraceae bacterium]